MTEQQQEGSWQKCHSDSTIPEDLGARLLPAVFSSLGRGWKKVYTKSHWNRIRKQGHSSVRQWHKEEKELVNIKRDLQNVITKHNVQFLFGSWLKNTNCLKNCGDDREILNGG